MASSKGAAHKPLLELETLVPERPFVTVDGDRYELAVPADFGILQMVRLERLLERLDRLDVADDELDDAAARQAEEIIHEAAVMVLRAPDEVIRRLRVAQKLAVVRAFGQASRRTPSQPRNRAQRRASRPTGASSSPASAASTAATTG
jgi:hypothetical protein